MLISSIDPNALSQTGWGVVFARQTGAAVKEALRPLLEHRSLQAGEFYKEIIYNAPESVLDFHTRHGKGMGPLDPKNLPFYLLLVGDPEAISFEFQYQLSVEHAVGRLHFNRTEEYAQYAEKVVTSLEREPSVSNARRAVFVSVQNLDDTPTAIVHESLVRPLVADLRARFPDWSIELHTGEQATKPALKRLLTSPEAPQLLFISAHGYAFRSGHDGQRDFQGSLICQDWPGPHSGSPIDESHVLNADDLEDNLCLPKSLVFLLSSYSAGTPQFDDFPRSGNPDTDLKLLTPRPFVNRLAQHLLSYKSNGALVVIGHVDRAWTTSIRWKGPDEIPIKDRTFYEVFMRLLKGHTVGWAMQPLVNRYVNLSAQLGALLYGHRADREESDLIAKLWIGMKDARNYIVLGDPAANLSIDGNREP